jgi:methyltransferase OMS1
MTGNPKVLALAGTAVLAFSTYCGYFYVNYQHTVKASKQLDVPLDVSDRYNNTAQSYDAKVDLAEWILGLGKRRMELAGNARGDVLEVSCGTGRNMEYYHLGQKRGVNKAGKSELQGCRSLTFVDQSQEMMDIARTKFEKLYPEFKLAAFRAQDAMKPIEPPSGLQCASPDTGGRPRFDTVIQTMGLCSHPDPVSLLTHLGTLTKSESGKIYLLEHGRSHYSWVNNILDNLAPAHADRHGCWWNRDIGQIVQESGLEIVESDRWHLGTTWRFVLRPRQLREQEDKKVEQQAKQWTSWIVWSPQKEG